MANNVFATLARPIRRNIDRRELALVLKAARSRFDIVSILLLAAGRCRTAGPAR
jgi:hypothetical protein